MVKVRKSCWKEIQKSGFRCRYKPVKTVHGFNYFLVDSDYEAYLRFIESKKKLESEKK